MEGLLLMLASRGALRLESKVLVWGVRGDLSLPDR
jgi:hypothetical protein